MSAHSHTRLTVLVHHGTLHAQGFGVFGVIDFFVHE